MRNCFISRNYKTVKSGGGRVRTDLEKIMTDMGFQNLGLQQSRHHNMFFVLVYTFTSVMKGVMSLRRGDTLVVPYPMKKYYEFVCDMAHRKGVKVVTVIHDLGCFRRKKLTVEREMERLAHSDALIVHNPTMHKWLKDHGYQGEMQIIGLFDYLSPAPITSKRQAPNAPGEYSIFFAGSLTTKHNEFIYMLPEQLKGHKFYLYGAGFREELAKEELVYKGFAADYELMENNLGDFGLSWYGESLTEGKGMIGEYMAYNNPHKILLYLRCNAPVIIGKTAALAPFIEENGIGICVDTLENLGEVLEKVTLEDYKRMQKNVKAMSDKIASGYFFRTAFTELQKRM